MREKISVAMATYNGERYIKEQIESILLQLQPQDEIVISDDGSRDKTIDIIKSFKDKRIHIYDGPKNGIKANFNNALEHCSGNFIFLCDQDDVWANNKVDVCLKELRNHDLVVHDAYVVDSNNQNILIDSFYSTKKSSKGSIRNIIRNTYIGCCMCFTKKLLEEVLPIPNDIEMHDQWIGVINDIKFKNTIFIKDKLINYRRHELTATGIGTRYSIYRMISNRFNLVKALIRERKI